MRLCSRLLGTAVLCLGLCVAPIAQAKRAPNLEFHTLDGASKKLADLRGSIVVINFWATWCGPCREELPRLSELSQQYADKKVRFIAISANESKDRAKVDQFLGEHKLGMDVWLGADLDMIERLGLSNMLPGTVVLDEQGEIITRVSGEARVEDIKAPLDWLLNGKSGAPPQQFVKRY